SVLDPRDRQYVLGETNVMESFNLAVEKGKSIGKSYLDVKREWKASAGVMTFDDAVKQKATPAQFSAYLAEVTTKITPLMERREISKRMLGEEIVWDWELPRTPMGQYMWQWSTKAVIERAILAAPLGDVTWSRQDKPNKKDMFEFHSEVRKVFPNRLFGFGYMGAYDFLKAGYTQEEFESFPADIAKMGVLWQVRNTQGLSLHARQFASRPKEMGIAGYTREVSKPVMATDKYGKPTAHGGYLADAFFDVVARVEITETEANTS
ncbi:Phosphoenolpyruvate/pyruvate domain-containing protein, partial [Mytilinidion resinicola]